MLGGVFRLAAGLAAFDAAVTEAGYNSFHEVLHAGLPSLVVPTGAAVTDDQSARARWAAEQGLALTAPEDDPAQVADAAAELLLPETRRKLADRCGRLARPQGASEAADLLCELAKGFGTHRFSPAERARVARLRLRPAVDRVMGMARREPAALAFTNDVTSPALQADPPAEPVLAGASAAYRAARERLARRWL
jgi:hypothetical protein